MLRQPVLPARPLRPSPFGPFVCPAPRGQLPAAGLTRRPIRGEHLGIEDVHGKPAPGDPEDGGVVEEGGEAGSVQRGRSHQHLELRSEASHIFDQPKEDVCVQGPLMSLVHHHHAAGTGRSDDRAAVRPALPREGLGLPVARKVRLREELAEQHPVGHVAEDGPL